MSCRNVNKCPWMPDYGQGSPSHCLAHTTAVITDSSNRELFHLTTKVLSIRKTIVGTDQSDNRELFRVVKKFSSECYCPFEGGIGQVSVLQQSNHDRPHCFPCVVSCSDDCS